MLNRVGRGQICYIYGGDGATFLIPSSFKFDVASALHGAQEMVRDSFSLDMRAGMVDVSDVTAQGLEVKLAKIEVRPGVYQTALSGNGASLAEKWIKDKEDGKRYAVASLFAEKDLTATPASFEGFECRWEPLKSRNGINVCLLTVTCSENEAENIILYQDILTQIMEICGTQEQWRPLSEGQLNITGSPLTINGESKVRMHGRGFWARMKYLALASAITAAGAVCLKFGWKMGNFDGAVYRADTINNTDFMKFENALKLVMDIPFDRKEQLERYLQGLHESGKIFYGIHTAPAAMMTCLVFNHDDDHFHFVDGADGGYTLAARQLKAQMRSVDNQHRVVRAA